MYCDQPPYRPSRRRIGDAVDTPGRAAGRRAVNGAGAALPARPVHVEEDGAIAFAQGRAVEPRERPANRFEHAGRDVAGNDRIGHAGQPAVPEVHVGPADLRPRRAQQRRARRKIGTGELADLDRLPRRRHDRGEDGCRHFGLHCRFVGCRLGSRMRIRGSRHGTRISRITSHGTRISRITRMAHESLAVPVGARRTRSGRVAR